MGTLARPRVILDRRAKAFERHLPDAFGGDVEGIHQARVASRRLREVLPLLGVVIEPDVLLELRRDMRGVTRALGPVRELDVAIDHLAGLAESAPAFQEAIVAVRAFTQSQRDEAFVETRRQLADAAAHRLRRRVSVLAKTLDDPDAVVRCASMVAERLAGRRIALSDASLAAGTVYAPGPLHDLRIALKKHRYAMEIALEVRRSRAKLALKRTKQLQDVLGELHDLAVLVARVEDYRLATRRRPLSTILKRLSDHLDGSLRTLHLGYLTEREHLAFILEESERAIDAIRGALPARDASSGTPPAPSHGSAA